VVRHVVNGEVAALGGELLGDEGAETSRAAGDEDVAVF